MPSFTWTVVVLAILRVVTVVHAQGVIISAKGNLKTSYGMQVDVNNVLDANYISPDEILANVVNECGRTLLDGDISISGVTEELLATGNLTTVTKGSNVTVTISQRNANGTGPFQCDMDPTSNALGISGQTPLTASQDSSQFGAGDLTLTVTMPSNLTCIGGSTGNVCTVRCVNAANFGGCFAVQQTDITPAVNVPEDIDTAEEKDAIAAQVEQNQKDLGAAESGLASAATSAEQAQKVAEAILAADPVSNSAATSADSTSASSVATTTGTAGRRKGRKGKHGNGNRNATSFEGGRDTGAERGRFGRRRA